MSAPMRLVTAAIAILATACSTVPPTAVASSSPASATPTASTGTAAPTSSSPTPSPTPSPTTAVATPRVIPASMFGLHPGAGQRSPQPIAGSWRLWDTGTMWGSLQPRDPARGGTWNWAPLDAKVAAGKAVGVTNFLLVLGMPPLWASSNPSQTNRFYRPLVSTAPPRSTNGDALWRAYVTAVAQRVKRAYPGTTWSFQVWNEANLTTFYTGTPERLATLTALADRAIQAVDPAFVVVAASTTTRLGIPADSFFPRYLRALSTARGHLGRTWPVDAFALHSYPRSTGTPLSRIADISLVRTRLAQAGAPPRPLWDTEINYGLAGPGSSYPFRRISGPTAADWLARTYLDSIRLNVARVYWYAWAESNSLLGITTFTDTPASIAMGRLKSWLGRATLLGCSRTSQLNICRFTRPVNGTAVRFSMLWTDSGTAPVYRTTAAQVCPVYGACTTRRTTFTVGTLPVKMGG